MRILFLIRSLNAGGAERQLVTLANGLARKGHDIHVALFYRGGVFEANLDRQVRIHSLEKRGRWDLFGFILRCIRILRRIRPEIAHSYLNTSNLIVLVARLAVPRTKIVWGVRASNMDSTPFGWLARVEFWAEALLSRGVDLVICNSRRGAEYAIGRGFPKHKVQVIFNGIDTERFQPDQRGRQQIRAELNVTDEQTLIGLAARVDPAKDHSTFLIAASLLRHNHNGLRFVCIGGGDKPYLDSLRDLSNEYGLESCLIWLGERHDMPSIYSALDVAISSSCTESFPNAVCEAMACAVPVVVTDAGDSAFIAGEEGMLVPTRDAGALAAAIDEVLRLPVPDRQRLGVRARQRICESFSIDTLCSRSEIALKELHEK